MMDQAILQMLRTYDCKTSDDYENALKQIIQQAALLGLWRSKFFEHAAFYGGTALRILYQLDRFSEDLDFSLLKPNENFNLDPYFNAISTELNALGFSVTISAKEKTIDTAIQSAFLKANTQINLMNVTAPVSIQQAYHSQATLKIKIEVDTDPPPLFQTEVIPLLDPISFSVKAYSLPDLFAGKISALLCRQWKSRVKGRDWYDFLWFIRRKTPVNLIHLESRLRHVSFYQEKEPLNLDKLKELINVRITQVDINLAKQDIIKFIKNLRELDGWNKEIFRVATDKLLAL